MVSKVDVQFSIALNGTICLVTNNFVQFAFRLWMAVFCAMFFHTVFVWSVIMCVYLKIWKDNPPPALCFVQIGSGQRTHATLGHCSLLPYSRQLGNVLCTRFQRQSKFTPYSVANVLIWTIFQLEWYIFV